MNNELVLCFNMVNSALNGVNIKTVQYLKTLLCALELAIEEDDGDLILDLTEKIKTFVQPFFVNNNLLVRNIAYKVFFLLRYVLIQDVEKNMEFAENVVNKYYGNA